MKPRTILIISTMAMVGLAGCATQPGSAALDGNKAEQQAAAEAPLGSRVKRNTGVGPVNAALREDREQARVQAGVIEVGAVQRGR